MTTDKPRKRKHHPSPIGNRPFSRPWYYRRDGTPYPAGEKGLLEWARDFEDTDRVVARTVLPNGLVVSTVWIGLDHNFGAGPPLIFETMVFDRYERPVNRFGWVELMREGLDQTRYSSEAEARVGHEKHCTLWSMFDPDTMASSETDTE